MLWWLSACTETPDPGGVADCAVEERAVQADGTLFQTRRQRWNADGHPVEASTELLGFDATQTLDERWRWSGDLRTRYQARVDDGAWSVETTTWTPDGRLLRVDATTEDEGQVAYVGTRSYRWRDGHLDRWAWDEGGDDTTDELFTERWTPHGFGWTVDVERTWDEEPVRWFQYREHDHLGRELFRTEDWDGDNESEVVVATTWDDLGRLVGQDVGGVAVVDFGCAWTWDGADRVAEVCVEEGVTWTTTWTHEAPGRAVGAEVWAEVDGSSELVETWTWTWTCGGDTDPATR